MKKIFPVLCVFLLSFGCCYAATITWIGPSGSNWNNSSNWSPAMVPGSNDDVIFNTAVTVNIDLIPASAPFIYLINSLRITGNASATISRVQTGGGIRLLQVKSTSNIIPGLKIDNGSSLTINAANDAGTLTFALDMTGAAGVTGQIFGSLNFTGTGSGTGDAGLNLYESSTNYSSLAVKSTGLIKYFTNSGNTASAAGAYLTMETGSTYEINKNGGSLPFGSWNSNSNILVTGATTNGNLYFNQSLYGNLKWDTPLMSSATQLISNLSPVTAISINNLTVTNTNGKELRLKTGASASVYQYTITGNFAIAGAGIVAITGNTATTAGGGARVYLSGSLNNAGVLKADGVAGTINEIELGGSSNQDISNTGTLSGAPFKLIMNNAAGATLLTPLILPGTTTSALQLNNGKIKTTLAAMLTLLDNANYSGGSSNSFIAGPMKKIGDDDTFSFPVGKGSIYAPVSFYSPGMAVTDAFQAEYFRLNPQTAYGVNYQNPPIDHISYVEYWQLQKTAGSTAIPANVTLTVHANSFAKDINTLRIARFNTADLQWKDHGIAFRSTGPAAPPYVTGSITSAPLTQYGIFTLGSSVPEPNNPLPVTLISFTGRKTEVQTALLTWMMGAETLPDNRYEVERSENGRDFRTVGTVDGDEPGRIFQFTETGLPEQEIWYRIKILLPGGQFVYSRVINFAFLQNTASILSLFPNPVHDFATLIIRARENSTVNFEIFDVQGRRLKIWNGSILANAENRFMITINQMPSGIYFISAEWNGRKNLLRFLKQ